MASLKREFIGANRLDLVRRIIPALSLVAMAIAFVGFFVNIFIGLDFQVTIITVSAFVAYGLCYLLSKKERFRVIAKWILFLFTLLAFNFYWHFNYGSHGPALYLFVILYSFSVFIFDRTEAIILGIIVIANLIVLFLIEYNNPGIVGKYVTDKERVIDVYSTLIYYGFIFYVFMSIAREAYFSEYKKAKRADQLKSSFLANMSHEIRTPLNAIVGFSNILADEDLSQEERNQYAAIINGSNNSLLRLVNDILDVSMIESDQLSFVRSECNVSELIEGLAETYSLKIKENPGVELIKNSPAEKVYIKTDGTRLQQVMTNLLDNAVKYTEKGKIEFGFTVREKELKFFVKDTGIGIKDSHIIYLFDRFYKVEDDTSKLFRGTGIGLYLSKKIVGLLGGDIWVESEYGKGSQFYFTIPKTDFRLEIVANKSGWNDGYLQSDSKRSKILIIEDQESNQQYYTALLKPGNFELIQAYNGKDGIDAFENHRDVDLILLDLKMPDLDGFQVLKEIRKRDMEVPVIAQTAYAMSTDKEKCLEAGFNDYVSKPVEKEAMFKLISEYIPRTKTL